MISEKLTAQDEKQIKLAVANMAVINRVISQTFTVAYGINCKFSLRTKIKSSAYPSNNKFR